jgi:hypothetical protein
VEYKLGQRVLFIDENQCEIIGVVKDREDNPDYLYLLIELDGGGYYHATLKKH